MNRVALAGLVRIELPTRTLRFSDGGYIVYDGEVYRSHDDVFGTIGQLETMSEGVGDIVPAITMTLLPPDETTVAEISQPGNQTSRAIFTIAEFDVDTNEIISSRREFDGQIDQTIYTVGKDKKQVATSVVSLAERLFEGNIGNTLNPTFHKSVYPGETGHDNATGLSTPVAWGVEAPRNGGSAPGGSRSESDVRSPNFNRREY